MPPNQDLHYLIRQNRSPGKGASLPTDVLISLTPSGRNHRSLSFQTHSAGTYIYKGGFFSQTMEGWNALPEYVMPFAKFTSLVRARDLFAQLQVLMNACHQLTILILNPILERKLFFCFVLNIITYDPSIYYGPPSPITLSNFYKFMFIIS